MKRKVFLAVVAALALAVPGAAFADAETVDLAGYMLDCAEVVYESGNPYLHLHPTGYWEDDSWLADPGDDHVWVLPSDQNSNSIPDATEFALLEAIFANAGAANHDLIHDGWKANVTQATSDLGGLAGALAPSVKYVMAAFATLGDGGFERFEYDGADYGYNFVGSWGHVGDTIFGMAGYGSSWNADGPDAALYVRNATLVSACGDYDGDTVINLGEYLGQGEDAGLYVAAAMAAGTTTDGGDPDLICEEGDGPSGLVWDETLFYRAETETVYYVPESEVPWPVAQALAELFEVSDDKAAIPADLATVDSAAETTWLVDNVQSVIDADLWIGGNDIELEGTWEWVATGVDFWQGVGSEATPTPGAPIGGEYTNWSGGNEPNDSGGEDFAEMRTNGTWNDAKIDTANRGLVEFPTAYPDEDESGYADFWEDLLSTTLVTVDPTTSNVLAEETTDVTATSSSEDDTSFTWESDDELVATVVSTGDFTATITAVAPGTAVITGTTNDTGKTVRHTMTVRVPLWWEACDTAADFAAQHQLLFNYGLIEDDDLEAGVGDLVPDAWQLYHLAYVLCEADYDTGAKEVDPAVVRAQFEANLVVVDDLTAALDDMLTFLAMGTDLMALGANMAGTNCDAPNSALDPYAAILGGLVDEEGEGETVIPSTPSAVIGTIGAVYTATLAEYGVIVGALSTVREVLAALGGMSSEYEVVVQNLLPFADIAQLGDLGQLVYGLLLDPGTGGILLLPTPCLDPPTPGGMTYDPAAAQALAVQAATTFPTIELPVFEIYGKGSKLADEPFSGLGDYDGDELLNHEVAAVVDNQEDYLCGVTHICGDFWNGNPALPVSGLMGLSMLAVALGGAALIRKRK